LCEEKSGKYEIDKEDKRVNVSSFWILATERIKWSSQFGVSCAQKIKLQWMGQALGLWWSGREDFHFTVLCCPGLVHSLQVGRNVGKG